MHFVIGLLTGIIIGFMIAIIAMVLIAQRFK